MNRYFTLVILLGFVTLLQAEKKPLDHSVYDSWKQINKLNISKNGNITFFEIQPQEGDGKLVFHQQKKGTDIIIERGYNTIVTPDESFGICLIKPLFRDLRQAKIKKVKSENMPKDSIAFINFKNGKIEKFGNILSFEVADKNISSVAFLKNDSSLISKKERKIKDLGKPLLIYNLISKRIDTIKYVHSYAYDRDGKSLAFVEQDTSKKSAVFILDIANNNITEIGSKRAFYSQPTFNETGNKLLYLASDDTISTGSKRCELIYFEKGKQQPEALIQIDNTKNFPKNWAMNENSLPYFSKSDNHIFVGIAPIQEPKDTTLVPFETAGLDLWNYADAQLPPMQLKRLKDDLKRTCLTVYNPEKKELEPLTTSFFDQIRLLNDGNSNQALSIDASKTIIETQWDQQNTKQLSLVNLTDGERKAIAVGKFSDISASPDGKFIAWYNMEDSQWYLYDLSKASTRCLTKELNVNFWDELNDTPEYADSYGIAGWADKDEALFINARFDIWKFPTDGSQPTNLTNGEGLKTKQIFRYINTKEKETRHLGLAPIPEKSTISSSETLLLSVFDNTTKKQGYATLEQAKKASPKIQVLDGYTFNTLKKSEKNNTYVYQKSNFQTSPDVYITSSNWKNEQKLSDINPQMKEYSWGTAELYKWNAYNGTPLEGLLYKPENFDPNKKYPVLIYFYERNSDKLYTYYAPTPSRSIINISFYCSRGYVVFVPDIVYTTSMPGESAYNCVVSGTESLAKNSWIDKDNMAIQGQSWGGYQVAYLVTRTNMFKAAEAGAPVSNMTSAYGGIRWETGMSRQFQYEHAQSRIGRTLWDAPELYIANSPLFRADKVETPLLIMHNDADGAVPWYQGIEYFMALRRLGKKVWLMEYNNEDHDLNERRNMKDLSIRLQQYFDYYLKGAPMPAWMKTGIPTARKGQYFGLENAE